MMPGWNTQVRVVVTRVIGYLLLCGAWILGIVYFELQSQHIQHVNSMQNLSPTVRQMMPPGWEQSWPEPPLLLFLLGVTACTVTGLLILEPGLRRTVWRTLAGEASTGPLAQSQSR